MSKTRGDIVAALEGAGFKRVVESEGYERGEDQFVARVPDGSELLLVFESGNPPNWGRADWGVEVLLEVYAQGDAFPIWFEHLPNGRYAVDWARENLPFIYAVDSGAEDNRYRRDGERLAPTPDLVDSVLNAKATVLDRVARRLRTDPGQVAADQLESMGVIQGRDVSLWSAEAARKFLELTATANNPGCRRGGASVKKSKLMR